VLVRAGVHFCGAGRGVHACVRRLSLTRVSHARVVCGGVCGVAALSRVWCVVWQLSLTRVWCVVCVVWRLSLIRVWCVVCVVWWLSLTRVWCVVCVVWRLSLLCRVGGVAALSHPRVVCGVCAVSDQRRSWTPVALSTRAAPRTAPRASPRSRPICGARDDDDDDAPAVHSPPHRLLDDDDVVRAPAPSPTTTPPLLSPVVVVVVAAANHPSGPARTHVRRRRQPRPSGTTT
jgi:hypothetical protein